MGCGQSMSQTSTLETKPSNKPHRRKRRISNNETCITFIETGPIKDKHLIKSTWKYMTGDMTIHGTKVFLKIFEIRPEVKQLFAFRDITGNDLLKDPSFRGHATRFMQAVGAAVDNVDNWDEAFAPLLIGLGRQHVNFGGFRPEYFDSFKEAMLCVWFQVLKEHLTEDVRVAWEGVFDFMMSKLKEGYALAQRECNGQEGGN